MDFPAQRRASVARKCRSHRLLVVMVLWCSVRASGYAVVNEIKTGHACRPIIFAAVNLPVG